MSILIQLPLLLPVFQFPYSREMYSWEYIDAADEEIYGLDIKVLCKEDDSDSTQVGGSGFLKEIKFLDVNVIYFT